MTSSSLPQRQPINEFVTGVITRLEGAYLLASDALPGGQPIAEGALVLRYGIPYLGKDQLAIVPDLVVLDYGQTLTGEAAWDFLMESCHLYPRSDALGFRHDGVEDMMTFKQLDFDSPYAVFAYRDAGERAPFCRLSALIATQSDAFPDRLLKHLPRFVSLDDWRRHG